MHASWCYITVVLIGLSLGMGCGGAKPGPDENNNDNEPLPFCGNDVVEGDEQCDGSTPNDVSCAGLFLGFTGGVPSCNADCTWDTSACTRCGDSAVQGQEVCDGSDLHGQSCEAFGYYGGELRCAPDCTLDPTDCVAAGRCGDELLQPMHEVCDGSDFGGQTCESLGVGYLGGRLACTVSCTLDESGCHSCGNGVIDPGETCEDANSVDWDGCTGCNVSEFQVNTSTNGNQFRPDVAMAGDGSFLVAWSGHSQLGTGFMGQWYDVTGLPQGGEVLIHPSANMAEGHLVLAMAPDGSFVAVWRAAPIGLYNYEIFARCFDVQGQPLGPALQVNTATVGSQDFPRVAMAADGRFVVVWQSEESFGVWLGVFARRFDAFCQTTGDEFQVNTTPPCLHPRPDVAMAADGRFVVVWAGDPWCSTSGYDILARAFDSDGAPGGDDFVVSTNTTYPQQLPRIGMAPDGRAVVVWTSSNQDTSPFSVFGQRLAADFTLDGLEFPVNTHTTGAQTPTGAAMNASGQFAVSWTSTDQDGSGWSTHGQRFDASGAPVGPELQHNIFTLGDQGGGCVAVTTAGQVVFVWQSETQDGSDLGVFGQRYDAQGTPLGLQPW